MIVTRVSLTVPGACCRLILLKDWKQWSCSHLSILDQHRSLSCFPAQQPKLLVVHPKQKSSAFLQEALQLAESYAGQWQKQGLRSDLCCCCTTEDASEPVHTSTVTMATLGPQISVQGQKSIVCAYNFRNVLSTHPGRSIQAPQHHSFNLFWSWGGQNYPRDMHSL